MELIHKGKAGVAKQKEKGCATEANMKYYVYIFLYLLSFGVNDA